MSQNTPCMMLLPLAFKPILAPSLCYWIDAVLILLKSLSTYTLSASRIYCKFIVININHNSLLSDIQIADEIHRIDKEHAKKQKQLKIVDDLPSIQSRICCYLLIMNALIEVVIQELNSGYLFSSVPFRSSYVLTFLELSGYVKSDTSKSTEKGSDSHADFICSILFNNDIDLVLQSVQSSVLPDIQRVQNLLSSLSSLASYIFETIKNEHSQESNSLSSNSVTHLFYGRMRRRVISLSNALYQFLSKMKHRIVSYSTIPISRLENDRCGVKDDDHRSVDCLRSAFHDLIDQPQEPLNLICNQPNDSKVSQSTFNHILSREVLLTLDELFTSSLPFMMNLMCFSITGKSAEEVMKLQSHSLNVSCIDIYLSPTITFSNTSGDWDKKSNPTVESSNILSSSGLVKWADLVSKVGVSFSGYFCYSSLILFWCNEVLINSINVNYMEFKAFINILGRICQQQLTLKWDSNDCQTITRFYRETADM